MTKKSTEAEIDRRIHTVVKLLSSAKTNSYILRFCTEEWGEGTEATSRDVPATRKGDHQGYLLSGAF